MQILAALIWSLVTSLLPQLFGEAGKVTITPIQSKIIRLPAGCATKPYYACWQGDVGPWVVDKPTNSILRFAEKGSEASQIWRFDPKTCGNVRTFWIHKPDSVLVYTNNSNFEKQLFWYDPHSGSIDFVPYAPHIEMALRDQGRKHTWETITASSAAPIMFHKGKIVASLQSYFPLDSTPKLRKPLFFTMGSSGEDFTKVAVSHPDSYRESEVNVDHATAYLMKWGDRMVSSFSASPELYVWDPNTQHTDTFNLSVPGIALTKPPTPDPKLTNAQFMIAQGYYGRLFYHEELKLFLRIVYLPTPLIDPQTGLYHSFEQRNACLFVWDENFVPQQFKILPPGVNDRNAFCSREGFAILDPNLTTVDSSGSTLTYLQYEITK